MHDRVAELQGLQAERSRLVQYGHTDRAQQAADQIGRVTADVEAQIEALEDRATELAEQGQDIPSAEAAGQARRLRAALAEATGQDRTGAEPGEAPKAARGARRGKQTAQAAQAPETAAQE